MNPAHWTEPLTQLTQEYVTSFRSLNATQLNWKPSPDRWSIGQVIEHVITINSSFFPVIEELKAGTYKPHFNAHFGFLVNFFGKLVLAAVQPEAQRKVKAIPAFEPSQSALTPDMVAKFEAHQTRFIQEINGAGNILDRVVSSPVSRVVVYRLDRAFDILVAHERRHLLQAKAVLAQLTANGR